MTILRDSKTSRQDFYFFADRLATLLAEHALQFLPFVPKVVMTPIGVEYHGQKPDTPVRFPFPSGLGPLTHGCGR